MALGGTVTFVATAAQLGTGKIILTLGFGQTYGASSSGNRSGSGQVYPT